MAARPVGLAAAAKRFRDRHRRAPWFLGAESCPELTPPCVLVKVQQGAPAIPREWLGHPVALVTYFYGGIESSRVESPPPDEALAAAFASLRLTLDEASRVLDRMLLEGNVRVDPALGPADLLRHLDDLSAAARAAADLARALTPGSSSSGT